MLYEFKRRRLRTFRNHSKHQLIDSSKNSHTESSRGSRDERSEALESEGFLRDSLNYDNCRCSAVMLLWINLFFSLLCNKRPREIIIRVLTSFLWSQNRLEARWTSRLWPENWEKKFFCVDCHLTFSLLCRRDVLILLDLSEFFS